MEAKLLSAAELELSRKIALLMKGTGEGDRTLALHAIIESRNREIADYGIVIKELRDARDDAEKTCRDLHREIAELRKFSDDIWSELVRRGWAKEIGGLKLRALIAKSKLCPVQERDAAIQREKSALEHVAELKFILDALDTKGAQELIQHAERLETSLQEIYNKTDSAEIEELAREALAPTQVTK